MDSISWGFFFFKNKNKKNHKIPFIYSLMTPYMETMCLCHMHTQCPLPLSLGTPNRSPFLLRFSEDPKARGKEAH